MKVELEDQRAQSDDQLSSVQTQIKEHKTIIEGLETQLHYARIESAKVVADTPTKEKEECEECPKHKEQIESLSDQLKKNYEQVSTQTMMVNQEK